MDICEFKNSHFLISVDMYSRYLEIAHLSRMTSSIVIAKMKNLFARHGVPESVISDNGTQFISAEFRQFAVGWNFHHVTSSPHYPQGDGAAERAVRTVKKIIKQEDVFKALLVYRSTPIPELGASPAELAMGRRLRTTYTTFPSSHSVSSHRQQSQGA